MTDGVELFDDALFSDQEGAALFLHPDERSKRYTAEKCRSLEAKEDLIILCITRGIGVELVAKAAHVETRTIRALVARAAEQVTRSSKELSVAMLRKSAKFLFLADLRAEEACFRDLMIGAGIAAQHGRELQLMGEIVEEKIVKEDVDELAVCAQIRELARAAGASVDSQSTANKLSNNDLRSCDPSRGSTGADCTGAEAGAGPTGAEVIAEPGQVGGGGGEPGAPAQNPDG